MNIYVGNIAWSVSEEDLESTFAEYGAVDSVKIIMDKQTGRSKGFGFVEMVNDDEGSAAVQSLNDSELGDRNLKVAEAKPREEEA